MKKTLAILAALAISFVSVNAYAQKQEKDNYLFNHWSIGVGVLEDFHVQVAGTILPNLQIRLLYGSYQPYIALGSAILKNTSVGAIDPYVNSFALGDGGYHQNGINIDKIDVEARIRTHELQMMVDFFPVKGSAFHVSGGLVFDISPDLLSAKATPKSNDGSPALQPSDMGKKSIAGISTDLEGNINLRASYGLSVVRPYVGIGFGRPVNLEKRVSVSFDMGLTYVGGLHLYTHNYVNTYPDPTVVEINGAYLNDPNNKVGDKTVKETLGADADKIIQYVDMTNTFPIMPYIRFAVNVRLF